MENMGHIWDIYGHTENMLLGSELKPFYQLFFVIFNDYLARTIRACPRE